MNESKEKEWIGEIISCYRAGFPLIEAVSYEESRVENILSKTFEELGVPFYSFSPSLKLRKILEDIQKTDSPSIFLIKDLHLFWGRPYVTRAIRDLLPRIGQEHQCIILLLPFEFVPQELAREVVVINIPLPSARTIGGSVSSIYSDVTIPVSEKMLQEVGEALKGLTMDQATRVLRKILLLHGPKGLSAISQVLNEKKKLIRTGKVLIPIDSVAGMENLGGAGELKRWLWERERAFTSQAREFGLPEPKGLMLTGIQGCGKSLSARVIAGAWGMPLWRLELPLVMGQPYPEAALYEALKTMDAMAPAILWIDEIEKVFQMNIEGPSARVMGAFITWLSEKETPVFVVATANEAQSLPPELVRKGRFDEIFFFDIPDIHEREEILKIHLRLRTKEAAGIDIEPLLLKTELFVGSELEQIVISALYRAFSAGRALQQKDLIIATEETVPIYRTYEEKIKELKEWAKGRTRPASIERRKTDFFEKK